VTQRAQQKKLLNYTPLFNYFYTLFQSLFIPKTFLHCHFYQCLDKFFNKCLGFRPLLAL